MKRFPSLFFHELGRVRLGTLILFALFMFVPLSHPIHAWYVQEEGTLGTERSYIGALALSHAVTFLLNAAVGAGEAPMLHLFFWGWGILILAYLFSVFLFAVSVTMVPALSAETWSRAIIDGRVQTKEKAKNMMLFLAVLASMGFVAEFALAEWFPTRITKPALSVPANQTCVYFSDATFEQPEKGAAVSTENYVRSNPTTGTLPSGEKIFLFTNSSAGIHNIPNCNRTRIAEDGTGLIQYHLNNYGLRMDKNITLEKKPGQKRVLVLGDSFAFGVGLDQHQTVTAFLQKLVGDKNEIEVLNGAVQGLSSLQSYLLYINEYQLLDPDIVIFLHYMNDIPGNLELRSDYFRPVYSVERKAIQKKEFGEKEDRASFSDTTHAASRYSHLLSLIDRNRDLFLNRRRVMNDDATNPDLFQVYKKQPTETMREALFFNCKVLRLMTRQARKMNDTFLIAYIPAHQEMDESYFKRSIRSFVAAEPENFDSQLVGKHLEACGKAADLPYLDLTPFFVADTEKNPLEWYSAPGGHWSSKATNRTAHVLHEWMKKEGVAS